MPARTARAQSRALPIRRVLLWSTVAIVIVAAIVTIGLANRLPRIDTQAPPVTVLSAGQAAPAFSAATTQGVFSLDNAKKPVFLEVFATWCPHCQRETSVINRLYDRYKAGVDFVAVSGSPYAYDRVSPESEADVLGFAQYFKVRYPIAFDGSLAVESAYLQGGYPTIAIIGSDKRISYIGSGEIAAHTLAAEIQRVLGRATALGRSR